MNCMTTKPYLSIGLGHIPHRFHVPTALCMHLQVQKAATAA